MASFLVRVSFSFVCAHKFDLSIVSYPVSSQSTEDKASIALSIIMNGSRSAWLNARTKSSAGRERDILPAHALGTEPCYDPSRRRNNQITSVYSSCIWSGTRCTMRPQTNGADTIAVRYAIPRLDLHAFFSYRICRVLTKKFGHKGRRRRKKCARVSHPTNAIGTRPSARTVRMLATTTTTSIM